MVAEVKAHIQIEDISIKIWGCPNMKLMKNVRRLIILQRRHGRSLETMGAKHLRLAELKSRENYAAASFTDSANSFKRYNLFLLSLLNTASL